MCDYQQLIRFWWWSG